jgi:hypothetical protein
MSCSSPLPVPPRTPGPHEPAPGAPRARDPPATDDAAPRADAGAGAGADAAARRRRQQHLQESLRAGGSSGSALDVEWERGGGGDGWVKRLPAMVPLLAVAAAAVLLGRAALKGRRRGGGRDGRGSRRSSESPAPAAATAGERPRRPRAARKSGGAAAAAAASAAAAARPAAEAAEATAAPAPAPEPAEPPPATLDAYASAFRETPQPPAAAGAAPRPLAGLRLAVAEHVAVQVRGRRRGVRWCTMLHGAQQRALCGTARPPQAYRLVLTSARPNPPPHLNQQGAPLGCGIPALLASDRPSPTSAPCVAALQAAGAHVAGHCSTQPLNAPGLGENLRNPAAPWRAAGGGATGAAAAVACAEADLGVGSELLGSVHTPAACMGVCSYFPTPGAMPGWEGAAPGGGDPEGVGLIAHDAATLAAVADALKLPGNPNLRHELTQVRAAPAPARAPCLSRPARPAQLLPGALLTPATNLCTALPPLARWSWPRTCSSCAMARWAPPSSP